jgi:hypothetical protein
MPTYDEALANVRRALRTNIDTLNMARGACDDDYVIWSTSGSWTGSAQVTLGDLRALVQERE